MNSAFATLARTSTKYLRSVALGDTVLVECHCVKVEGPRATVVGTISNPATREPYAHVEGLVVGAFASDVDEKKAPEMLIKKWWQFWRK